MNGGAVSSRDHQLPSALESAHEIIRRATGKRLAVFLDYDGTLTPIVPRPELATLSEDMRLALRSLAAACTVGIISGRDRADVERLVGLDSLVYAGSHGFDIAGAGGRHLLYEAGTPFLADLDGAERTLADVLSQVPGTLIERKNFSVAVHYRLVRPEHQEAVDATVNAVASQHPNLRTKGGKKVYELLPRIDWDKGKAVLWLLRTLDLEPPKGLPLYLGDDLTDEDAFTALQGLGVGIVVGELSRQTAARYALRDTNEVRLFLEQVVSLIEE